MENKKQTKALYYSPAEYSENESKSKKTMLWFWGVLILFLALMYGLNKNNIKNPAVEEPSTPASASATSEPVNAETISYTEFLNIETGMTYDEVCKIIGSYGAEMARNEAAGYQTVVVAWEGEGAIGANANVTFQNGTVVAKAQAGLK